MVTDRRGASRKGNAEKQIFRLTRPKGRVTPAATPLRLGLNGLFSNEKLHSVDGKGPANEVDSRPEMLSVAALKT